VAPSGRARRRVFPLFQCAFQFTNAGQILIQLILIARAEATFHGVASCMIKSRMERCSAAALRIGDAFAAHPRRKGVQKPGADLPRASSACWPNSTRDCKDTRKNSPNRKCRCCDPRRTSVPTTEIASGVRLVWRWLVNGNSVVNVRRAFFSNARRSEMSRWRARDRRAVRSGIRGQSSSSPIT